MNITKVQVHILQKQESSFKALADIILDNDFKISGFQIREDQNTGEVYVDMPFRIRKFRLGDGRSEIQRINVVYPINRDTHIYLENKILDEYERVLNIIAKKDNQNSSRNTLEG